jgi:hypothetical protein
MAPGAGGSYSRCGRRIAMVGGADPWKKEANGGSGGVNGQRQRCRPRLVADGVK